MEQISVEVANQDHEPSSSLSEALTGAAAACSTSETEAFAVFESEGRLEYLLAGREFVIFTDHQSLQNSEALPRSSYFIVLCFGDKSVLR